VTGFGQKNLGYLMLRCCFVCMISYHDGCDLTLVFISYLQYNKLHCFFWQFSGHSPFMLQVPYRKK